MLGQDVTLRGDPSVEQELVLGCRWHWELQEKEQQWWHHSWSRDCTSWDQLCLSGLSSSIDPGICLNIFLHSLRRYTALEQGEDKKIYKRSCELLSGPYCWYWLPPETSTLATDTWICVCRKKKDLFSLPQCLHFSACFCQTALMLQVGQCYRSTFFETMEILRIYGYSDEVFKYDGKCILSKAECCDTCVLCSPCPQWSQAVIVVSCDFRSMMVLHFGFRRLSMVGDSRPSLSIL